MIILTTFLNSVCVDTTISNIFVYILIDDVDDAPEYTTGCIVNLVASHNQVSSTHYVTCVISFTRLTHVLMQWGGGYHAAEH